MKKKLKLKKITSCLVLGCFFSALAIPAATAAIDSGYEKLNEKQSDTSISKEFYQIGNQVTTPSVYNRIEYDETNDIVNTNSTFETRANNNYNVITQDQVIAQKRKEHENKCLAQVREMEPGFNLRFFMYPKGSKFELKDLKVEAIGDITESNNEVLYVGVAELKNNSNKVQNLNSQEFSFTQKDSMTVSTTNSVSTSITASAGFSLPVIGGVNTSLTSTYEYGSATSNTNGIDVNYKVPSQSITLDPGQSVQVRARLERTQIKGATVLNARLVGEDWGAHQAQKYTMLGWWNVYSNSGYYQTPSGNPEKQYTLSYNDPVRGKGTYSADYGTKLYIEVVDLKTNSVISEGLEVASVSRGNRGDNGGKYATVSYNSVDVIDMSSSSPQVPEKKVTLYKDDNYHGASVQLGVGKYTYKDFSKIGNNNISSLKVPEGLKVILYDNDNFTGEKKIITANTDLYKAGFNDRTSSIEITLI